MSRRAKRSGERPETLAEARSVAKGVGNGETVIAVAARLGVELPICERVRQILDEGKPATAAVADLLARERNTEFWGV